MEQLRFRFFTNNDTIETQE